MYGTQRPELKSCVKVEVAVPNSPYGLCGRKATFEKEDPEMGVGDSTSTFKARKYRSTKKKKNYEHRPFSDHTSLLFHLK